MYMIYTYIIQAFHPFYTMIHEPLGAGVVLYQLGLGSTTLHLIGCFL